MRGLNEALGGDVSSAPGGRGVHGGACVVGHALVHEWEDAQLEALGYCKDENRIRIWQ